WNKRSSLINQIQSKRIRSLRVEVATQSSIEYSCRTPETAHAQSEFSCAKSNSESAIAHDSQSLSFAIIPFQTFWNQNQSPNQNLVTRFSTHKHFWDALCVNSCLRVPQQQTHKSNPVIDTFLLQLAAENDFTILPT